MTTGRFRRRLFGAALLVGLLGVAVACGAGAGLGGGDVVSRRLTATPAGGALPVGAAVGVLRLESVVSLSGGGIGGLSGLAIAADGVGLTAVTDEGRVWRGRLRHDGDGRLEGVDGLRDEPLFAAAAAAGKFDNDSEEIAAAPGGGWFVSFERRHRILRFGPNFAADGSPETVPAPPGLALLPENGGVEALAVWPDGAMLAIEEGADDETPERRAWFAVRQPRGAADWRRLTWRRAAGYRPTGAAALPNGDALVLERRFSLLGGVGARLSLLPAADLVAGVTAAGRELARLDASSLPVDNFEGVAVTAGRNGDLNAYLVSDDNFSPLQNTLLLHFTLPVSALR